MSLADPYSRQASPRSIARAPVGWLCLLLWAVLSLSHAAADMHLLRREMFTPSGVLTAAQPGTQFSEVMGTLHQKPGGPHLADGSAASVDFRDPAQATIAFFDIEEDGVSKVFAGAWFLIKSVQGAQVELIGIADWSGHVFASTGIVNERLGYLIGNSFTGDVPDWQNRWIYLGAAIRLRPDGKADLRYYIKQRGGEMQPFASLSEVSLGLNRLQKIVVGSRSQGTIFKGRMGAPAVYSFEQDDFSDVTYPAEILEPETRFTWYCDPHTGDDNADGRSPQTAWKSAAKVVQESTFTGLLPAPSYAEGDTLIINTSGADLDLAGQSLELSTPGLTVKAAEGEEWIKIKSWRSLPASVWQPTAEAKVYSTTDTQASVVLWEDDRFMHHVTGNTFDAVKGELKSRAGSFWTDGVRMYVHPFGSTDPRQDGKRYERSYLFPLSTAVRINASHTDIRDIHAGKTTLAEKNNNDPLGNSCLNYGYAPGKARVSHCFLYYGSKHNFTIAEGLAGDDVLIEDVQCEQGSPYPPAGGQTLFVSFNHRPEDMGIVHRFVRCRSSKNTGVIGSAEGVMSQTYPVYFAHNLAQPGEPQQFSRLEFEDCDFGTGNIQGNAAKTVVLRGTTCGSLSFDTNIIAERCKFYGMNTAFAGRLLTERNCIHVIGGELRRNQIFGNVDIRACTLDARGVTNIQGGLPEAALFMRGGGPLSFTFKNNLVIMPVNVPQASVFSLFTHADSMAVDYNGYQMPAANSLHYNYAQAGGTSRLSFNQWRALGKDTHSFYGSDLALDDLRPGRLSPLIDAGEDLGPLEDYDGNLFDVRNDMGAHEVPARLFEEWLESYLTPEEVADPEISDPLSSSHGGDQPNLIKYAFGEGGPKALLSGPLFVLGAAGSQAEPMMELSYYRSRWAIDLAFKVETSVDLHHWSPAEVVSEEVTGRDAEREQLRVLVRRSLSKAAFVRLNVRLLNAQ